MNQSQKTQDVNDISNGIRSSMKLPQMVKSSSFSMTGTMIEDPKKRKNKFHHSAVTSAQQEAIISEKPVSDVTEVKGAE